MKDTTMVKATKIPTASPLTIFDIVAIKNALASDGKPDEPALFWTANEGDSGELVSETASIKLQPGTGRTAAVQRSRVEDGPFTYRASADGGETIADIDMTDVPA